MHKERNKPNIYIGRVIGLGSPFQDCHLKVISGTAARSSGRTPVNAVPDFSAN